jgi:hypothetical protein
MKRSERIEAARVSQMKVRASPDLMVAPILTEEWREYDFGGRVYRINLPVALFMRKGGSTHRILDRDDVVHCLPAPGYNGCILRWSNKDKTNPVEF